jgi:hypothetical protein
MAPSRSGEVVLRELVPLSANTTTELLAVEHAK